MKLTTDGVTFERGSKELDDLLLEAAHAVRVTVEKEADARRRHESALREQNDAFRALNESRNERFAAQDRLNKLISHGAVEIE